MTKKYENAVLDFDGALYSHLFAICPCCQDVVIRKAYCEKVLPQVSTENHGFSRTCPALLLQLKALLPTWHGSVLLHFREPPQESRNTNPPTCCDSLQGAATTGHFMTLLSNADTLWTLRKEVK